MTGITTHIRSGIKDLASGLRLADLWLHVSFLEIKNRYQGSIIGPFWISIATFSMIIGMGLLYAGLFQQSTRSYIPYLAVSLTAWTFLASFITDATRVFLDNSSKLKGIKLPISYYIFKHASISVIVLFHNLIVIVLVYAYYRWDLNSSVLLAIPALVLWIITGLFVSIPVAIIATRFRDVGQIIASFMQLAFFLTPVMWESKSSRVAAQVNQLNPFYYYLEVLREPLFGRVPSMHDVAVCLAMTCIAGVLAMVMLSRYGRRIVFWL